MNMYHSLFPFNFSIITEFLHYISNETLGFSSTDNFFEYVAGRNTFEYCKPDPKHLTSTIEIMNGCIKKSLMIGDSENDAEAAKSAGIPMILLEEGNTDKKIDQIYHDHLIKDFNGIEKIIINYLND